MPYLDVTKDSDVIHATQLFLYAHPHHRATVDALHARHGRWTGYSLSLSMVREMAAWAVDRQMIPQGEANRVIEEALSAFGPTLREHPDATEADVFMSVPFGPWREEDPLPG
jgi:hypothetical protein